MNKKSFGGVTPQEIDNDMLNDMEEVYEGLWLTKKEYEHNETDDPEEVSFKYKYAVRFTESPEDNCTYIELSMVFSPDSLHPKQREAVCDSMEYCDYADVVEYGVSVQFGSAMADEAFDEIDIEDWVTLCANVIPCMNRLRGFTLDRAWNMIGTTGWDMINHAILNEPLFHF